MRRCWWSLAVSLVATTLSFGAGAPAVVRPSTAANPSTAADPSEAAPLRLSFPFPAGESWFASGSHGYSLSRDSTRSSVDFSGPSGVVTAAAPGTIRIVACAGGSRLAIDHGGGWWTSYYHVRSLRVSDGQIVERGEPIASIGQGVPCGGEASYPHVHFSVWHTDAPTLGFRAEEEYPIGAFDIGGWRVVDGGANYDGHWMRSHDGHRAGGELATPLANQGEIGSAPAPAWRVSVPARFEAIGPRRLLDTRTTGAGALRPGSTRVVAPGPGTPSGASAVLVNLTVTRAAGTGHLTATPCDDTDAGVSTVNFDTAETVANSAIVRVGSDGLMCLRASVLVDVIVDLQGVFAPTGSGFRPVGPLRAYDTRSDGPRARVRPVVPLRVPIVARVPEIAGSTAVVATITATDALGDGHASAAPCAATPTSSSTVNFRAGQSIANTAVIPVGTDGQLCVWTSIEAHVVVDVIGAFVRNGGLRFTAVTPVRVDDSRLTRGLDSGTVALDVASVPRAAAAVAATVTAAIPQGDGFIRAHVCSGTQPNTSMLNTEPGRDRAAFALLPWADSRTCITSTTAMHRVVDIAGWFSP